MNLDHALEQLPKVELHCHVEGTMRPSTVLELADRNGVALPTRVLDDLYRYGSLNEFLSVFWLVQSCLKTPADWARLAYESVIDGAAHGRVYAESFFTPARHLAEGQPLAGIVAGLTEGIEAAERETGATCMLIADMDKAYGPAAGEQLVDELVALRKVGRAERVIGLGMDSTEIGVDPRSFLASYRTAAKNGLHRTGHQGEDTGPEAIAACLDVLGVERVDHGLSLLEDDELTARVAGERIPLTVCPTSNIVIANRVKSLAEHPFKVMRDRHVLATLNTDDPAMTDLDLGREYRNVAAAYGWTFEDMVAVSLDGVEASWLDEPDKRALRSRVEMRAAELQAE